MLCQTKHLIYQALSEGCWQNREDIDACEKRLQKASTVELQGIYFGNLDQQSCKTSPMVISNCTLTSGCQRSGISQSYFCVVRATHNSNPWAQAVVPPFACFSPPGFRATISCVTHDGLSERGTTRSLEGKLNQALNLQNLRSINFSGSLDSS